jgi:ESCRT-II complex subunit VPS36
VTRLSAGREYHQQLARQIGDILLASNRLRRLGGMITLSDVYCLYNRARGTELVSPDDVLEASKLLRHLKIGHFISLH